MTGGHFSPPSKGGSKGTENTFKGNPRHKRITLPPLHWTHGTDVYVSTESREPAAQTYRLAPSDGNPRHKYRNKFPLSHFGSRDLKLQVFRQLVDSTLALKNGLSLAFVMSELESSSQSLAGGNGDKPRFVSIASKVERLTEHRTPTNTEINEHRK